MLKYVKNMVDMEDLQRLYPIGNTDILEDTGGELPLYL